MYARLYERAAYQQYPNLNDLNPTQTMRRERRLNADMNDWRVDGGTG